MPDILTLLQLFWEFFKTGLFSVGGGLATIPFLKDISTRTGWYTHADLQNMVAVAESTPGPIGVNAATYVGFSVQGVPGGIVATIGLVTPSVIIIIIIAAMLNRFRDNKYVNSIFNFIRPASLALICSAAVSFALLVFFPKDAPLTTGNLIVICLMLIILLVLTQLKPLKKLHPVVWIGISAVVGIIMF